MPDEVLNTDQVAAMLQTTPRVVAELLVAGDIVGVKVGRHWRIAKTRVLEYIRREGKK